MRHAPLLAPKKAKCPKCGADLAEVVAKIVKSYRVSANSRGPRGRVGDEFLGYFCPRCGAKMAESDEGLDGLVA